MKIYKNHEGYADNTAGMAIERVKRRKKKRKAWKGRLVYQIGELESFKDWVMYYENNRQAYY